MAGNPRHNHASKVGGYESGEARSKGAKHPDLRAKSESKPEKAGGGVWEGGLVSPFPEFFLEF